MVQILILLATLFLSRKPNNSTMETKPKSDEQQETGRTNQVWVILIICVLGYVLYSGWRKTQKEVYSDNIGKDAESQQAQLLRQAFNPSGTGWLMAVDGTDEETVMAVAAQISNYGKVADAYRVLYGADLSSDLADELTRADLTKFWDIVYKRTPTTSPPTTTPGGGFPGNTNPPMPTTPGAPVRGPLLQNSAWKKKTIFATATVNVRDYNNPKRIVKQVKKGAMIGTYWATADYTNLPNTGNKNRYVITNDGGINNDVFDIGGTKYLVVLSSVTI